MDFKNKIVLVTGSSSGIGQATIFEFAKHGAKVVIHYNTNKSGAEETLNKVKKLGSEGIILQGELSLEENAKGIVEETISHFGTIDILVNNVGGYIDGDEWDMSSEAWEKTFDTNVISTLNMSKYVAKHFIENKKGVIINLSSRYGVKGYADTIAYSAAKAAIINITGSYSRLLAPFGRANSVAPGAARAGYFAKGHEDELENVIKNTPIQRIVEPIEIASMIVHLSSDHSKSITGQNILIDGGFSFR